jgi:hypothetical protein
VAFELDVGSSTVPCACAPVQNGRVRAQAARWLALSRCGLSVALAVAGIVLNLIGHPETGDLDYGPAFPLSFLGFSLVGALIASHPPRTPIGWLLPASALHHSHRKLAEAGLIPACYPSARAATLRAIASRSSFFISAPLPGTRNIALPTRKK